jgi:hypothetical protein
MLANKPGGASPPPTGDAGADQSIDTAMGSGAAIAHQTSMPALPGRYLLVDAKSLPPECVIPHSMARGPNWRRDESIVVLTFTRPAIANGYGPVWNYFPASFPKAERQVETDSEDYSLGQLSSVQAVRFPPIADL